MSGEAEPGVEASPEPIPNQHVTLTSDPPRENMIATAIRFLQNPKVAESPLSQRKAFLEKKGLTVEEIELAIQRAGVAEVLPPVGQVAVVPPTGVAPPGVYLPPPVPVSGWSKARDYAASAIVIGGLSYALYVLYKKYIQPLLYGPSAEEKKLDSLQKSILELQSSINQTLTNIQDMQTSIVSQQNKLETFSSRQMTGSEENMFVKEVKDEIKSLKGLMLSRKQFPPTPSIQPVGLPAWQLAPKPAVTIETSGDHTTSEEIPEPVSRVTEEGSRLLESLGDTVTLTQAVASTPDVVSTQDSVVSTQDPVVSTQDPVMTQASTLTQDTPVEHLANSGSGDTLTNGNTHTETDALTNGHLTDGPSDDHFTMATKPSSDVSPVVTKSPATNGHQDATGDIPASPQLAT